MGCKNGTIGCNGPKNKVDKKINLSSITNIMKILGAAFKLNNKPVTPIPPPLLIIGAKLRPGLSPRTIASRIISRQSEAGAPVGDIYSEDNNISESMEMIRVQEIISAILTEGKVEIVIPSGSIQTNSLGVGNLGIPIASAGTNINIISGDGVIR